MLAFLCSCCCFRGTGPAFILPTRKAVLQVEAQHCKLHFCSAPCLVRTSCGSYCSAFVKLSLLGDAASTVASGPLQLLLSTHRLRERSEREQRMQALWEQEEWEQLEFARKRLAFHRHRLERERMERERLERERMHVEHERRKEQERIHREREELRRQQELRYEQERRPAVRRPYDVDGR